MFRWLLLLLCALAPLRAAEPLARLAIISGADAADLAALLSASLPQYTLLERDDLARIGDEQRLATLAQDDGGALGRLAGSDGLLFLSREEGGYRARLTAVHLGFALFDVAFDKEATPEAVVRRLVSHLEPLAGKLALPPQEALPLTVLNLRADLSSADSAEVERNATLLLESRLAQLPQVVLLERRRPAELAFERALTPHRPELLRGVYLIDGSLQLSLKDDRITAALRIRSPQGAAPVSLEATESDLPGLVETLVSQIAEALRLPAPPAAAPSLSEAREYLHEGIWAYNRALYSAAIAALDSAELLGETAPDLLAIRIPALAFHAATTKWIVNHSPEVPIPDDHPYPDEAIASALRAMDDFRRYKESGGQQHLLFFNPKRTFTGRTSALEEITTACALKLLAMLDRTGHPAAGSFRADVRAFLGYDPVNGKIPRSLKEAITFAGNLSFSKEEETAFYRAISTDLKWAAQRAWFMQVHVKPDTFCWRFISDAAERKRGYFAFWEALRNHPVAEPAALFYFAKWAAPEEKDAACRRFYRFLFEHREALLGTGRLPFLHRYAFTLEKERNVPTADPMLIETLLFLLRTEKPFKLALDGSWLPELFPNERAGELWVAMKGYQERVRGRGGGTGYFTMYNRRFVERFGDPDATRAPKELLLTRFWQPKGLKKMFYSGGNGTIVTPREVVIAGTSGSGPRVYFVSLPDLRSRYIQPPERFEPKAVALHGGRVFLLTGAIDAPYALWRYDPGADVWKSFSMPKGAHRLFSIGERLYFTIEPFYSGEYESAVGVIDPETGEHRLLASSRRRPARTPFDDTKAYAIKSLFEGPGGSVWAIFDGEAYQIREEPGNWQRLSGVSIQAIAHQGRRSLLQCWSLEKNTAPSVLLVDPEGETPELLTGPVRLFASRRKEIPTEESPPVWTQTYRWPAGDPIRERCESYALRGEDLIGLQTEGPNGRTLDLLYYRKGHAKPLRIPLHFRAAPAERDTLARILSPSTNTFEHILNPRPSGSATLHLTEEGILIQPYFYGLWHLPYADLDAYLANVDP